VADWRADPPAYYDFGFNVGEAMKVVLMGAELVEEEQYVAVKDQLHSGRLAIQD
jgi:hypothetical protein